MSNKTAKPYLSVVIPAYNEEDNFKRGALEKVEKYLKSQDYTWEVIVVDDGSTDETPQLVEEFTRKHKGFHLIKNPHYGKAHTVTTGVMAAQGKYILFTDFDQATPISEIEKMWPLIEKGVKVVIGSREGHGARRIGEPLYRHIMGRGFNFLVQLFAVRGIEDTQCGFKLFTNEAAKKLFSKLRVYKEQKVKDAFTGAWDVEVLLLAKKFGYKIAQTPVEWRHIKTSRVNPVKDSLRMLRDILLIRWNDLRGEYDK